MITISSSFGTGGSVVASKLAALLGWELINRAITVEVAAQLSMPLELAEAHDERLESGWRRLFENFVKYSAQLPEGVPSGTAWNTATDEIKLRRATEIVLRETAKRDAVIVGRAAAIVLHDMEQAMHVRLDGPRNARLIQGAEALGLGIAEAETKLDQTDRTRAAYVREMYDRDWRDASLYHLIIDSTRFSIHTCVTLIATAAHARFGVPKEI